MRAPTLLQVAFAATIALFAAVLSPVSPALAQGPFSLTGIGPNIEDYDARITGRGGWGMAETDTLLIGFMNPAGLVSARGVTVLVDGVAEVRDTDGGGESRQTRRVSIPSLRVVLPVFDRAALSAGLFTRRATQYETAWNDVWYVGTDTVEGVEKFTREGTQYEIPLLLSMRVLPGLSVGAGLHLVKGSMRDITNIGFGASTFESGDVILPSSRTQEDHFHGKSGHFAVLYRLASTFAVGGSWRPGYDLEVEREVFIDGVAERAQSTLTYEMPPEWRAGATASLSPRWSVGGDYGVRAFSEFSGRDDWEADMQDEWTAAFGIERTRELRRHGGLSNLPLRLGLSVRRWGYLVGGESITERTISIGTGFAERSGSIDVALSYGWLGSEDDNGYRDSYVRVTISVFDTEKWW